MDVGQTIIYQHKKEVLISLCIPVMNRADDLKQTLPKTIEAANASAPVEIVILNYDSKDDLDEYIKKVIASNPFAPGVSLTYKVSPNHKFFSISHSRNLAFKASHGDYTVILDADIIPHPDFVERLRGLIEKENPVWMVEGGNHIDREHIGGRMLVTKREEFEAAGGYDERFRLCGPEDKDICMRLYRRGGKFVAFDRNIVDEIRTDAGKKIANLDKDEYEKNLTEEQRIHNRVGWTKYTMQRAMRVIYEENCKNNVLVANQGKLWGM